VRVPDNVLKCVTFIGEVTGRDESGRAYGDLHATAFLVNVTSKLFPQTRFVYVVTAKHVARDLQDREVYILANDKFGGVTSLTNLGPQWWTHPTDSTADIAVRQLGFQGDMDVLAVPERDFVTPESMKAGQVALGDECFITGLFTPAPGTKRNTPIIRHGNISMLPEDQIQTELGFADVYLVEARSIGGLSGSPVFTRVPLRYGIEMPKGTTAYFDAIGPFKLLGVMQGHWSITEDKINESQIEQNRKHGVNLGIGIVIPAIKILETINQPGLAELRRLGDEDMAKTNKSIPGLDSAKREPTAQGATFTRDDFEAALKKATRKIDDKK